VDIAFLKKKIRDQEYDLSVHAHNERQEDQITVEEIEKVILKGDIIEQYPNDLRGESCLVSGIVSEKPLHVVCGMRGKRLLVITVYRPKLPVWIDYKTRTKEVKSRE
jgi:hypothetical protein